MPPMSDLLEISDQVKAYLAPENLAGIIRAREHTVLKCFVCEGSIPPESKESTTISLFADPIERVLVAQVAHSGCAPSQVEVLDMPREAIAEAESGSISYVQLVMGLPDPTAAILWERDVDVTVRDGEGNTVYPYLEHYRALGFVSGESIPMLDDWTLGLEQNDLVLRLDGNTMEEFGAALEAAPEGWFDVIEQAGHCLAMIGVGLGLDRFDPEQLGPARLEDRLVAAAIGVAVT